MSNLRALPSKEVRVNSWKGRDHDAYYARVPDFPDFSIVIGSGKTEEEAQHDLFMKMREHLRTLCHLWFD